MTPKNAAIAAALALAACAPEFDPASKVDGLRVLAVRAEPPEIAPAPGGGDEVVAPDRAALSALVLRGDAAADPARKTTVLYLACVPTPGDPAPSPCVALGALRDPTTVLADAARASCAGAGDGVNPPVAFAGAEACDAASCAPARAGEVTLPAPELAVPPGYRFDALAPGAPARILGVQAVVLAFAVDATPDELAADADGECPLAAVATRLSELWGTREHVLATKRVLIRGPDAPDLPNRNPVVEGIAADGIALEGGRPTALAGGTIHLAPVLPGGADALHEPYTKLDAAGVPIESAREDWVYSWFGTAGELDELHTRGAQAQPWAVAAEGPAVVAVVARDLRGGVAWAVREVTLGP